MLDNDVLIKTQRSVNNTEREEVEQGRASLIAPLPNLRATYFHAFTPRLAVLATVGWLSLSYDQYDGDFRYLRIRDEYLVTDSLPERWFPVCIDRRARKFGPRLQPV